MASGKRLSYEEVKQYFAEQGCELLSNEYKNAHTKVKYRCSCDREAEIVFYSFKAGNRCRQCGNAKISERFYYDQTKAEEKFKAVGCQLIGEYLGASKKVSFRCHCGEISEGLPNNIWRSGRCKKCGLKARSGSNHYMWYHDRDQFKELCNFKDRCHKLITMVLNVTGRVKNKKSAELLGYDYKRLQEYIKSHPNWAGLKGKKWHVDHIFPIKAFIDHGISDLKIINALDNLRPIEAAENCSKNAKYDKDEFYVWLKTKGIDKEILTCITP